MFKEFKLERSNYASIFCKIVDARRFALQVVAFPLPEKGQMF